MLANSTAANRTMRAAVRHAYGGPERVEIRDVPRPVPGPDGVLVRARATSLNASDWESLTGSPAYVRMWGLSKPRFPILGSDVAGTVEAVGERVTRFAPGDEVYGDLLERWGGFAEYVVAPERAWVSKPAGLSFELASTLPQAACVAWQGLGECAQLRAGKRVLINGAGGGSGTFAIQLAKATGAEVTAVDSEGKAELLRSLGADHVLDYAREDFTRVGDAGAERRYDWVLDFVAQRTLGDLKRVLNPGGRYLAVGGSVGRLLHIGVCGPLVSFGGKRLGVLVAKTHGGLAHLAHLVEAGALRPVIEHRYTLDDVPEALRVLGAGEALGKLVITL